MSNDRKLALIEWEDSAQPSPSWRYLNDAPPLEVVLCVSVGWIIQESDSVLMLAPNIGDFESSEGAQGSGFIRIPKAAITRKAYLKEASTSSEALSSRPDLTQKRQVS